MTARSTRDRWPRPSSSPASWRRFGSHSQQKAERDDVVEPLERLTRAIERLHGVSLAEESDDYAGDSDY